MWYSKRNLVNFRTDAKQSYRPGYAESKDGVHWQRLDESLDFSLSDEGWDSEAIAYPYVREIEGKLVMLYNGNGFGATGFGYAVYE